MLQYFAENKATEQPKYNSQDFIFRWKKIERIVEKQGLDGLLLITGLDGAEHPRTSYIFNWLFLGMSGQAIFANRYLDDIYSDIIVFISSKASFIFITPEAKAKLNTLIYTIQNCTIFCPTIQQFNSKDQFEILKIAFFYNKISKFSKVGFFLESDQQTKVIQKWPIIQSYALEPVGRTFFTLKFETHNIQQKLNQLFKNLDKNSLQHLIYHSARSLEGQIMGSLQLIQYTKNKERDGITELKLQQPLFESADISSQSRSTSQIRVLFGRRTGQSSQTSKDTSLKSNQAFHFTVQHIDPLSKLSVWRTYFVDLNRRFNTTVKIIDQQEKDTFLIKKMYKLNSAVNYLFQKRQIILNAYLALIQSVIEAIATVSKDYRNLNPEFLSGSILTKINQLLATTNAQPFVKNNLHLQVQSFDSMGQARPIDLKDSISFKLTSTFYVIKCRLNNITLKETGQQLGSVCFSEGFLLQQGCYLLLTKSCPYFQFWKCSNEENTCLENLNPNIQFLQLGPCLTSEFKNRMFIPLQKLSYFHFNLPLLNTSYYLHEKGIRLFNEKIGWHLILYEWIEEASMINKINGQWVLFRLQKPILFQGLESNLIALQFRGKAFDHLLQKVNDKNNPLPLTFIDIIPSVLSQNWYFTEEILRKQVKEGAIIHQQQILQNDFLWSLIQAKQLMIINQMKDIKLSVFKQLYQLKLQRRTQALEPSQKRQIIIINGGYATNKFKLAQTISKFGQASIKYPIFRITSDNLYSKVPVPTFLQMLQQFVSQQEQALKAYVVVIIPSWLNCSQALPLLAEKYHIRSVVAKINVSNFFTDKNSGLTQNVLTFALPGYSQSVVIECGAQQQGLIGTVTNILRGFNREAHIMRSSNGMLSTGQCLDISKDNQYNTQTHKFLRNKYGSMYKFDQLNSLSANYIEFKYPIADLESLRKLTQQEGYLVNIEQIQQQLIHKKLEAELSKDELMQGLYRLEELVALYKKRQKVSQIRLIRGVVKQEDGRKVEIIWSNSIFKVTQTSTQRTEGLFILSRNYDQLEVKELMLSLTRKKAIFANKKGLRRQEQLTTEQKVMISKSGRDKYLSNGQFYDGYFYRDVEGNILQNHPNLSLLMREYIESQNSVIQKLNLALQSEWEEYCKKYA